MTRLALGLACVGVVGLLSVAPAAAADQNWSGWYWGPHGGWVWGSVSVTNNAADGVPPGPFDYSANGPFGGLTTGFNWEFDNVVFGIEGDLGYMNLTGSGIVPSSHPGHHQDITLGGGLYGDIAARLGIATEQMLVYGKGGFAFYSGQAEQATTVSGYAPSGTATFTGWMLGAGIAFFVTPDATLDIGYEHFDFGTQSAFQATLADDPPTPAGYRFYNWHDVTADAIKISYTWHFPAGG